MLVVWKKYLTYARRLNVVREILFSSEVVVRDGYFQNSGAVYHVGGLVLVWFSFMLIWPPDHSALL